MTISITGELLLYFGSHDRNMFFKIIFFYNSSKFEQPDLHIFRKEEFYILVGQKQQK